MALLDAVTLARRPLRVAPAQTMIPLGDSLTEQGGLIPANPDVRAFSAWSWGNVLLGQRFQILKNAGVGGQNTTQILARLETDCLSLRPGWVHLLAGTNNLGVAGGVAQAKADLTAILDRCAAAGAQVAWGTIPPRIGANYTGTIKADTFAINAWIVDQARQRPGVVLIDYFTALTDGASNAGNYATTLAGWNPTSDGTHLSATGGYICGKAFAAALSPRTSPVPLFGLPTPGPNLISDPRFTTGTGTAAPTAWTLSGSASATATWSKTARTDIPGSWQNVVVPNGSTGLSVQANASVNGTSLAVGDTVVGVVEFNATGLDQAGVNGSQGLMLHVKGYNGTTFTIVASTMANYVQPNTDRSGWLRTAPLTIPSGITIASLFIEIAGGGTYSFDRAGVYRTTDLPSI